MQKEIKPLPPQADTRANEIVRELTGTTYKQGRRVETPSRDRNGDPYTITEDLITIELQDGSTVTFNNANPDYENKLRQIHAKIENDIEQGKRTRKAS